MTKNLSNIEIYHHNATTDPVDGEDDLSEHANIVYKNYYSTKQQTSEWAVFSYECRYCSKKIKLRSTLIKHLETCKGLDD